MAVKPETNYYFYLASFLLCYLHELLMSFTNLDTKTFS
jgi:hypothetical protein